jgi:cytoskeleton protein RodZ
MHRARRGGVAELLQKHPGAVLTGAVALVICAVLVVLWAVWPDAPERSIPERQTAATPNSTEPAVAAEPVEPAPVAVAPESPAPATVDTPDATQPVEARAVDSNGARRITSGGDDRLSFVFTDNCWVEIKDSEGVRLFGDLGLAGTSLELVGQAPFRILLGNAPGVTLSFNGERVALTPHTRNNVGTLVLGQ